MQHDPIPQRVKAHELEFELFISAERIAARVRELGQEIARRHPGSEPLFLPILNGSAIFAADLVRACPLPGALSFVRLSSYEGTASSGTLTEVFGLEEELSGRHVIVVEDIVDSGTTLARFLPHLRERGAARLEVAALLSKPEARQHQLDVAYTGFEIPDRFVIGYGLDYRGKGRGLPAIYQLREQ